MDDSIDYRRIRKQSKSLLKWGTGLNKTMRNTMKTGSLQSIYDSSQSTGEESRLSSGIYSTNSKGGALIRQSSVPDLKVIRTETTPDVPLSPNQSFHRKCQHTFKMYSKHPTSVSSTDRHQVVGIPYSDIDDAIEALEEILELPIKHLVAKDKYFHKGGVQTIVEYSSFYLYACKLFDRKPETAITHSPNSIKINDSSKERQHSSAAINAPTLVRRDRSLVSPNELLTQDGFAIPITDPNASVVTLKGTVIPSTYLKDAIVDSYRRHNTSQSVENWNTTSRGESCLDIVSALCLLCHLTSTCIYIYKCIYITVDITLQRNLDSSPMNQPLLVPMTALRVRALYIVCARTSTQSRCSR